MWFEALIAFGICDAEIIFLLPSPFQNKLKKYNMDKLGFLNFF